MNFVNFVQIGDRVINPNLIVSVNLNCLIDKDGDEEFWGVEVRFADGRWEHFEGEEAEVMRRWLTGHRTFDLNQIYGKPQQEAINYGTNDNERLNPTA